MGVAWLAEGKENPYGKDTLCFFEKNVYGTFPKNHTQLKGIG